LLKFCGGTPRLAPWAAFFRRFAADVSLRIAAEAYVCSAIKLDRKSPLPATSAGNGSPRFFLIVTGERAMMIQPRPAASSEFPFEPVPLQAGTGSFDSGARF
jgi:hypothetical protein